MEASVLQSEADTMEAVLREDMAEEDLEVEV